MKSIHSQQVVEPLEANAEAAGARANTGEEDSANLTGITDFLRRVGRLLVSTPVRTMMIVLALLIEACFTATVPLSFRYLVDHAIASRDGAGLMRVLAILAGGVLLAAGAGIGRDYLWARFSIEMLNRIRSEMFEHLLRLSMDFFARTEIAEIGARFSTDLASVEAALSASPGWALVPALDATVALVMLFVLDWRLALVGSLVIPVSLLGPKLVMSRAAAASYSRKIDESGLVGVVQENVMAHSVVRAFGLEEVAFGKFRKRLNKLGTSSVRTAMYGSLLERSSGIGTLILQIVVLGVGATMAYRNLLSIGSLAAFQTLFLTLSWSIGYVSQYFPYLLQAAAGTRRIEELLRESPRVSDQEKAGELTQFVSKLRFESVVFGYNSGRRNLNDLTFEFPAGASVAFVGPSGCGKSTVLSLLMRFYDPSAGRVTFDGIDIGCVTQASLRSRIGVVFQDTILFNTSIRENIRLGKLGATDAEVEAAARAAEMHDLILQFAQGYDTPVGERGGRLSGGQRQRIAIARAILRDPQILVLDEATSALDAETEVAINRTLERLGKGRTVVSVTHRLAAVAACSHVFVLESGRLVEAGSHDELLARDGLYSRLWRKQSGVSVEGGDQRATITPASLREISIFRNLDEAQHILLAARLSTERIPAGREVFRQGDRGDALYVIARGTVTVTVQREGSEAEELLAVLQDGDYFGEIALIEDSPRTATIRTRTDCVFLTLPSDAFLDLLDSSPDLRARIENVSRERRGAAHAAGVRS
jgi:ATP-binding cassette, subfamily B, bacterial